MAFVVYSSDDEIFVTTTKKEAKFLLEMAKIGRDREFDQEDDENLDRQFDREEFPGNNVQILPYFKVR